MAHDKYEQENYPQTLSSCSSVWRRLSHTDRMSLHSGFDSVCWHKQRKCFHRGIIKYSHH